MQEAPELQVAAEFLSGRLTMGAERARLARNA